MHACFRVYTSSIPGVKSLRIREVLNHLLFEFFYISYNPSCNLRVQLPNILGEEIAFKYLNIRLEKNNGPEQSQYLPEFY